MSRINVRPFIYIWCTLISATFHLAAVSRVGRFLLVQYTKWPKNYQMTIKYTYQVAVKYYKWPENIQNIYSKDFQNILKFGFCHQSVPSGNPSGLVVARGQFKVFLRTAVLSCNIELQLRALPHCAAVSELNADLWMGRLLSYSTTKQGYAKTLSQLIKLTFWLALRICYLCVKEPCKGTRVTRWFWEKNAPKVTQPTLHVSEIMLTLKRVLLNL
jgi:hypothetical protein